MSDSVKSHNYAHTLTMPVAKMAMKSSPQTLELELLSRWESLGLHARLRETSKGRPPFVLHDGPPYANGNTHLGHALNKVLKDALNRSFQMRGFDANYVPGWDCHGLPIEWKVEEKYRAAGLKKDDVPVNDFRQECRTFASTWQAVQSAEFQRLGVLGDFANPYLTMSFEAEAATAAELMKLAATGQVYRGSKPVMWSVVERTALAEAEVEHLEFESDTAWVKFPVLEAAADLVGAFVVAWTTTPWTLPANRALAYSARVEYGLFEVLSAENDFGPQSGEKFLVAQSLAEATAGKAKLVLGFVRGVSSDELAVMTCRHPLHALGYDFVVPLLEGSHVTEEAGTGFVHTAPGHGTDDFELWTRSASRLSAAGYDTRLPFVVDDAGYLTDDAPGFGPSSDGGAARVYDDNGKKGDANARVFAALVQENVLFARARVKHQYPHSWRSKKPVMFRNTPQWFVSMDKPLADGRTLRARALLEVQKTAFTPESGRKRLASMLETRPDWVLSRQRRWGVPLTLFCDAEGNVLFDDTVNAKVLEAFRAEGADAWFAEGSKERFLGHRADQDNWQMVQDILDVWFDSGCSHAFTLEARGLPSPADVYLEGSDQHRGWFMSSLLESCATRDRAPFKAVVTHGFVMADDGQKMAKSGKNGVSPSQVVERFGADVLRLWVLTSDYKDDVRVGEAVLKTTNEAFRKLRNTLRWMTGMLGYYNGVEGKVELMPELERFMLHRLVEVGEQVRQGYDTYDFKKVVRVVSDFMNQELSAFYFDVRKDVLYCDPASSVRKQASLQVLETLFRNVTAWLAPVLPFTTEEAYLAVYPDAVSVHLEQFPELPVEWRDASLAEKWAAVKRVRSVVTACLEAERQVKRIGSALEAAPSVFVAGALASVLRDVPMAEVCITSGLDLQEAAAPSGAFTLDGVDGVSVVFVPAPGVRCARSWVVSEDVGGDPDYPDVSLRDAAALRELALAA
jgi:isoleucyl-tRNA synthetase